MWSCLYPFALCLTSIPAWAAIVPVTLRHPQHGLWSRDLRHSAEVLRPAHEVELLYADDVSNGPPMLVRVSTKHDSRPYVILEEFEDMLSTITCSTDPPGNGSTTLSMRFRDERHLAQAAEQWSNKDSLTFVTHHESCNPDLEQREAYRSSLIRFDHNASLAVITCNRKEFGYDGEASTSLRVQGGIAPRHLARRLNRRTLGKRDTEAGQSATEKTYGFSLDQTWEEEERLLSLPGQIDMVCKNCSTEGEITFGFDVNFPHLDPVRWIQAAQTILEGGSPEPLFDTAQVSAKVTRPVKMVTNIHTSVHTGVSVRWPGLLKPTDDKPVLGEKVFWDGTVPLFQIGAFNFMIWWGLGLIVSGAIGGKMELTHEATSSMSVGESSTVNLLDMSKTDYNFHPQRGPIQVTVNKAEAAAVLKVTFGAGADITIKVKVPDMNIAEFLSGAARGLPGFKDGQISFYGGFSLAAPSLGAEIDTPSGLDENCKPSLTTYAVKVLMQVGLGIAFYASWAFYVPGMVIPRVNAFPLPAGPPLYHTIPWGSRCFVVGHRDGAPQTPLGLSTQQQDEENSLPPIPVSPPDDNQIYGQPHTPGKDDGIEQDPSQPSDDPSSAPERHSTPLDEQPSSPNIDDGVQLQPETVQDTTLI